MAYSKAEKFGKDDVKLAKYAKAIAHPARIAILRHLASGETSCFNTISAELPLADSTVSQHLFELRKAGLIKGIPEPPRIMYSIDHENWKMARKMFKYLIKWKISRA